MSFKGDLSTIGLAEVFQMISMSQKEGTLIVQDVDSRKCIFFGATGVQLLSSGKRKGMRVGEMLLRAGKVSDAQLEEALENGRIQRKMVGEVLIENGVTTPEVIQQVVREQIEEEIYDLFLWKRANFEFIEGPAPDNLKDPEAQVTKLAFDVNGLLLESVRRADEWAVINQHLPSVDSIFVFVSDSDRHEEEKAASEALARICLLVDGRTPVSDIVESTGISRFDVCKSMVDLLGRGRIRLLTPAETMELAVRRMGEGHRDKGMRLYLAAAAQSPNDAKVLAQVARFMDGEGLAREGAGFHVKAGRIFLDQGDTDRALDHMQSAVAADPDNPDIKMGMFEVHAASGNLAEGKKLAQQLANEALMAPDLPRARALCDRILRADPEDMDFHILRAKALSRANQKVDLEEDLQWIRKRMPVDPREAERIQRELKEILVKAPSTVHPPASTTRTPSRSAAKGRGKTTAAAVLVVLLGLVGVAAGYEFRQRGALSRAVEESRVHAEASRFGEARRVLQEAVANTHSPTVKSRGAILLKEIDTRESEWDKRRLEREENDRAAVADRIRQMAASIEEDRRNSPAPALERALQLRELAERHKDPVFQRQAEELVSSLEKYMNDAYQLKMSAETLEKEGKMREAALVVDRLLSEFPNTGPASGARYPLEIVTRPLGVKVTNLRTGSVIGETAEGPIRLRMKPGEAVRLLLERPGYLSVERDVKDKTLGRISVDLLDKREQWVLPLGVTVAGEPALLDDTLFVAGGSRLYALKTSPKRLHWFETLDGTVEGSPKVGGGRVYVATAGRGLFAIDPNGAKRVAWRCDLAARGSGTPGTSADAATVWVGSSDRMLHAIDAATGRPLWKRELPGEVRVEPLAGPDGSAIAGCDDGTILAVKGAEGEFWRARTDGGAGPMTLASGVLYVPSTDQNVYAFDAVRGVRLWRRGLPTPISGRVVRVGNTVFAAGKDGRVHFLDAATGEPQGSFEAQGPVLGGLSTSGSLVIFGSDDQFLYAFDSTLRALQWRMRSKGKIRTAAVAGGGSVYFGSEDNLYAVDLN